MRARSIYSKVLIVLLFSLVAFALVGVGCKEQTPKADPIKEKPAATTATVAEEETPKDAPTKQQEPMLWQIDGANGPVYMLGTIHLGFDAEKELPGAVWERFDKSEVFVMETDLSKVQASMLMGAALPEGESLKDKLGEEHWKKLDVLLEGAASQFTGVKPWFIVSILIAKMLPNAQETAPMDQVLHTKAVSQGKKLDYLEPPELQLSVLEKALTIDELKEMLDEFEQQKKDLVAMLEFYREGDIEGIQRVSFKDADEKPEMYDELFYKRNAAWVPKIEGYVERGNVFVAFGAGHMFGEKGVLKLLEEKGHKPVRITLDGAKKRAENEANTKKPDAAPKDTTASPE